MSPHPVKDIDLDRKEELIMAKQLRAARVTILPKRVDSAYVAKKEPKPAPPPTPKAQPRSVAKAQNPIALRYWSQCMALSTQEEMNAPIVPKESLSKQNFDASMPPWALSDTNLSPNLPNPSVNGGVHRTQPDKFGIKVPNINKQIKLDGNTNKRTDWAKILAEEDEHLEKHKTFKMNQNQRLNIQETPNFLRKHRSINSKTPGHVRANQGTSDTIQNKSLPDVKNEDFFEHIRKMKNIEARQKCTESTTDSLLIREKQLSLHKTKTEHNGVVHNGEPYIKVNGISVVEEKNMHNSLENKKSLEKHKILQKNGNAVISEVVKGNETLGPKQEDAGDKSGDGHGSGQQLILNEKKRTDSLDRNNEESQVDNTSSSYSIRKDLKMQTWDWKSKPTPKIVKNNECSCNMASKTFQSEDDLTDMGKFVNNITLSLDETQIKEVGILCFDKLSPDVKDDLLGRHLSAIHVSELTKLLSLIKEEVLVESLSNIIPKLSSSLQSSVSMSLSATKDTAIHCQPEENEINQIQSNNGEHLNSSNGNKKTNYEKEAKSDQIMKDEIEVTENKVKQESGNEVDNQTKLEDNIEENIRKIQNQPSFEEDREKSKSEKDKSVSTLRTEHIESMNKEPTPDENSAAEFECSLSDEDMNISVGKIIKDLSIEVEDQENFEHNKENGLNDENKSIRTESKDVSQNLENQLEEDETSNDISHLENDKDELEKGISEIQMADIEGSDPEIAASGDESWEYEWEEEEDYYEQDDEEYKVQTFDGSFSVSLKH